MPRTQKQREAYAKLLPPDTTFGEGPPYQDERFTGQRVVDRKLGVKGRYRYSFVSRVDGKVYHMMIVDQIAKGRGFKLGCPISRPDDKVEVA